jgi:hypothetical protein
MKSRIGSFLLAGLLLAASSPAWGAVAGTGNFDIDVHTSFPFTSATFDGTLTFDNASYMVGGTGVNMSSVNPLPYSGIAALFLNQLRATFDVTMSKAGFSFDGNGEAACTNACINGTATFVGDVDESSIVDTGGVLPSGFDYVFDGTVGIDSGGNGPGGEFALNAFAQLATPMGNDVMVTTGPDNYFDTKTLNLRDFLVEAVFAVVNTPGVTTVAGVTAVPGALPNGITLIPDESVYVDITTTAGFTPPVTVCVAYTDVAPMDGVIDGTSILVSQLRLLHRIAVGDAFQDVTTTATGGKICGVVQTLSPFVVAAGPTTTTTTSTTTSTVVVTTSTTTSTVTTTTLPELLGGKKLLLKDKAGSPEKRGINLLVTGGTLSGGNGSEDDPTAAGGTLRVVSAVGGFDDTYDLPASGWKLKGKAGQNKGYKFKGSSTIKSVMVKPGKLVAVGKGSGLGHSLTTNPAPVSIILGLGAQQYCMSFGGTVQFKDGKKFLAKSAPAPADCGSPSGAFLD